MYAGNLHPIEAAEGDRHLPLGDLLLNITPGGTNQSLKASNDLLTPFEEVESATLEDGDTTYRVPATSLNPGREFFRIEQNP